MSMQGKKPFIANCVSCQPLVSPRKGAKKLEGIPASKHTKRSALIEHTNDVWSLTCLLSRPLAMKEKKRKKKKLKEICLQKLRKV